MYEKNFQFMVFTLLKDTLNLCIFIHALVPHSKLQAGFFVFPKIEGVEKTMISSIKIQSENMKMTWNRLFIFCMIYNFSKCDGFTIM